MGAAGVCPPAIKPLWNQVASIAYFENGSCGVKPIISTDAAHNFKV